MSASSHYLSRPGREEIRRLGNKDIAAKIRWELKAWKQVPEAKHRVSQLVVSQDGTVHTPRSMERLTE